MSVKTDNSQTLVNALAEIEKLRGRVSELEDAASWCEAENGDMQSLMAMVRVVERGNSGAWLLRKQAEAVEAANDSLRNEINDIPGSALSTKERHLLNGPLRHIERYAQRLHQQADELEAGGGNDSQH